MGSPLDILLSQVVNKARGGLRLISRCLPVPAIAPRWLSISASMALERRRGRKTAIVCVEEPGYVQYLLPVVDALKKRGLPLSWYIATDYSCHKELASFSVSRKKIFPPDLAPGLRGADLFLSASVYGRGPRNAVKVNLSHNQPVKVASYPREGLSHYDVHFLLGPLHRSQYEDMFARHGLSSEGKLLDVGYPKSDALLNGQFKREEVLGRLGLDPARPTVLYAPAWDPGASLRSFGEQVIDRLLALPEVNVLAKLHPVSYTPPTSPHFDFYTGGVDWVERLSRFEEDSRFRHVRDHLVDPLLSASDVMVTDISSVALEFMVLDRPVIYLDCPEFFEKTLKMPGWNSDPEYVRNDPRGNAGRHAGLAVYDLDDIGAAVRRSLDNPAEFSGKRLALAGQLLYNPGRAAEAAADAIVGLMAL